MSIVNYDNHFCHLESLVALSPADTIVSHLTYTFKCSDKLNNTKTVITALCLGNIKKTLYATLDHIKEALA